MLYTIIIVLIIIAAILLGLVVLLQDSKGGGLTSSFSSSNNIMGVRKTANFLEKATWTLAISIVVLCFASSILAGTKERKALEQDQGTRATKAESTMPMSATAPAAATAPAQTMEQPVAEEQAQ